MLTIFNEQVRVHLIEFIIGLWQCSPPLETTLTLSEHDASKSKRICPKNSKKVLIIQILYELNLFTINRKWFGYNYRVRRLSVWVRRLCENWFLSVSIYLQVGSLIRIHNIISVWSKPLSLCDTLGHLHHLIVTLVTDRHYQGTKTAWQITYWSCLIMTISSYSDP